MAPWLGDHVIGAELCRDEGKLNPLVANRKLRAALKRMLASPIFGARLRGWSLTLLACALFMEKAHAEPNGLSLPRPGERGRLPSRSVRLCLCHGNPFT